MAVDDFATLADGRRQMTEHESERKTRKTRVDPKLPLPIGRSFLRQETRSPSHRFAIEEYETDLGPADYVLADRGDLLGVVEAKKLTLGPQGVLPQAERYARAIPRRALAGEFGVPFLYSTNGEEIWFHDVRRELNRSRRIAAFHTTKALREMLDRDNESELASCAPFLCTR